jgi:hypothetical protein
MHMEMHLALVPPKACALYYPCHGRYSWVLCTRGRVAPRCTGSLTESSTGVDTGSTCTHKAQGGGATRPWGCESTFAARTHAKRLGLGVAGIQPATPCSCSTHGQNLGEVPLDLGLRHVPEARRDGQDLHQRHQHRGHYEVSTKSAVMWRFLTSCPFRSASRSAISSAIASSTPDEAGLINQDTTQEPSLLKSRIEKRVWRFTWVTVDDELHTTRGGMKPGAGCPGRQTRSRAAEPSPEGKKTRARDRRQEIRILAGTWEREPGLP